MFGFQNKRNLPGCAAVLRGGTKNPGRDSLRPGGDHLVYGFTYRKKMSERVPAIKVLLLPKDTNALGTIFGGVIMAQIDLASAVEARKIAPHRYVTRAIREVEFHAPVFVGDIVNFFTETKRIGNTSVTVKVLVEVERWGAGRGECVKVTEAEVVLVAVDADGHAVPVLAGTGGA